jgi:hypothetical protein
MKYISRFFFFVISFFISSSFLYLLAKAGIIEEFKPNNFLVFVEYIFIGFFMLYSFPLIETIISKKHKGIVVELLKQKEFPLFAKFTRLKIKRQFFLGVLDNKSLHVFGITTWNNQLQKGVPFVYYYAKYFIKGKKIRIVEKKNIFFQVIYLLIFLSLAVIVRFLGYFF